ncbi:MAG: Gldg family protein [Treponema sp.]|nr:Gldg family protein [Treponema sp.]
MKDSLQNLDLVYFKKELKYIFTKPLFYLLGAIFFLFITINFFIAKQFFIGNGSSDLLQLFSFIPYISILVIPTICYQVFSNAYSDFIPLKNISKIFYSYLARVIYFSVLQFLLIIPVFCVNIFGSVDFGQFFTSFLCSVFFGMALISICFFINQIIPNKIAAFLVSALSLIIFNTSHLFSVYIPLPLFISELLKKLSFAWHFDGASKGIFDTRDFLWFICIAFFFILASWLKVEIKKEKYFSKNLKFKIAGYFLLIILIQLNSSRWYKRWDFSKNKQYSLSKYTLQMLKNPEVFSDEINQTLKITYYRSAKLASLYPQVRDVTDFLISFSNQSKNIKFLIVNPDKDSKAVNLLESYGITSQQLRTVSSNSTEFINVYSAIVLEYEGKIQTIPFLLSAETLEYDLDIRLKQLFTNKLRLVNIVLGNEMTYAQDYDLLIPWLNAQGFVCNPLSSMDNDFVYQLENTEGTLLVIGDNDLNIEKAIAIEEYILSGKGNAFFAVSPYSANISTDWALYQNKKTNIVEILENWGVLFSDKILADISCSKITLYSQNENQSEYTDILQGSTYTQVMNYPMWISLLPQENCKNGMTLFWPVELELDKNAYPYLVTSPAAYTYEIDRKSPQKLIENNPFVISQDDISLKEKRTRISGAQIKGSIQGLFTYGSLENANIIVIPDQYFVNSLMIGYNGGNYGDYRNLDFLTDSLLKLNGENQLAELHENNNRDKTLNKISDTQSFIKYQLITYLILFLLVPVFILVLFVFIHICGKKQSKNEIMKISKMLNNSKKTVNQEK